MQIRKEFAHVLFSGCYRRQGAYRLALGIGYFFCFSEPDTLMTEADFWSLMHSAPGGGTPVDMGLSKGRAEILVRGECCAPAGDTATLLQATVRFGGWRKTLDVFGDRHWMHRMGMTLPSEPIPFSAIPLDYSRAFGGAGHPSNPLGRGYTTDPGNAASNQLALPNVEEPRRWIDDPHDRPPSVALDALPSCDPARLRFAGTYDERWLATCAPDYPEDADLRLFNLAAEDQWLPDWIRGDETGVIENMHPVRRRQEFRLPGWHPRVFLEYRGAAEMEAAFAEIPMIGETLWLFPGAERGLVIYRGEAKVADDEAGDVARLFVLNESRTEAPRPFSHYRERWSTDKDFGMPTEYLELVKQADSAKAKAGEEIERFEAAWKRHEEEIRTGKPGQDNRTTTTMREPNDR